VERKDLRVGGGYGDDVNLVHDALEKIELLNGADDDELVGALVEGEAGVLGRGRQRAAAARHEGLHLAGDIAGRGIVKLDELRLGGAAGEGLVEGGDEGLDPLEV